MNILLTGGMGYIGSHTALVLAEFGHRVVLYDNLSNSDRVVEDKLKKISGQAYTFIEGDILDCDLLRRTLSDERIDSVIHFAASKSLAESIAKPIEYYNNNITGTLNLIQAMEDTGIKNLLFSSSASVYGAPEYLPMDECHPTSATNPYSRSKLYIEEMLSNLSYSDNKWHIVCLRYFNPVGAHQSGLIGENPKQLLPSNLMPYIARVASGELPFLNIFGDDYDTVDGTGVRDFIHVMDLAQGHLSALSFLEGGPGFNVYNLGTGKGYSVLELIKAFEEASGRTIPYKIRPRRVGDVSRCFAKVEKASEFLGWHAKKSLKDMCESTWNFQKNL